MLFGSNRLIDFDEFFQNFKDSYNGADDIKIYQDPNPIVYMLPLVHDFIFPMPPYAPYLAMYVLSSAVEVNDISRHPISPTNGYKKISDIGGLITVQTYDFF